MVIFHSYVSLPEGIQISGCLELIGLMMFKMIQMKSFIYWRTTYCKWLCLNHWDLKKRRENCHVRIFSSHWEILGPWRVHESCVQLVPGLRPFTIGLVVGTFLSCAGGVLCSTRMDKIWDPKKSTLEKNDQLVGTNAQLINYDSN